MQARSEETRKRIIQVAVRLFSDHGYDSAGVAEICEAADVSKGAFYHHFETKHEIFMGLLNRWLGRVRGRLVRDFVPRGELLAELS